MENYSLVLTSSSGAVNPVTVAELKAQLRYNQGSIEDTLMADKINMAVDIVEKATLHSVRACTYTVTYYSGTTGQLTYWLPMTPLASVSCSLAHSTDLARGTITLDDPLTLDDDFPFTVTIVTDDEVSPIYKELVMRIAVHLFKDREGSIAPLMPMLSSYRRFV